MFRVVTSRPAISRSEDHQRQRYWLSMRQSWPQHLQLSRSLQLAADEQSGIALALMGVALLMLAQDLLDVERAARHAR